MCNKCFTKEFLKFDSEVQFLDFDKILTFKLINDKTLISKEIGGSYGSIYFDSYQCLNCKEEWCLSIPDNAWRGFFLTKNNCTNTITSIKKTDKAKKLFGYLIILVLISMIILYLVGFLK